MATASSAPTALPAYTTAHLRTIFIIGYRPSSAPMSMRQLPVNSSAPATSTRNRPRQNARPPKMSDTDGESVESARTISMKDAPRATKAPARIASTNALPRVSLALANPMWTNAS